MKNLAIISKKPKKKLERRNHICMFVASKLRFLKR